MRPLAAALSLGEGDIILTGEPRMKERPIGHLVDALRQAAHRLTIWSRLTTRLCGFAGALWAAISLLMVRCPVSF